MVSYYKISVLLCFNILYTFKYCEAYCKENFFFMIETSTPDGYSLKPVDLKTAKQADLPYPYNITQYYNNLLEKSRCDLHVSYLQPEYKCKVKDKPKTHIENNPLNKLQLKVSNGTTFQCYYEICNKISNDTSNTIKIFMKDKEVIVNNTNDLVTFGEIVNEDAIFTCNARNNICETNNTGNGNEINIHVEGKLLDNDTLGYNCNNNNILACQDENCKETECKHKTIKQSILTELIEKDIKTLLTVSNENHQFQCNITSCNDKIKLDDTVFITMKDKKLSISEKNNFTKPNVTIEVINNYVMFSCNITTFCPKTKYDINIHIEGKSLEIDSIEYNCNKNGSIDCYCDKNNCNIGVKQNIVLGLERRPISLNVAVLLAIMACFLIVLTVALVYARGVTCSHLCYRKHTFYVPPGRVDEDVKITSL